MRGLWFVLCLLSIALPSSAEQVVAGLSRDQVSITANFDGSDILIYGAVKREAPISRDTALEVIITVAGPSKPVTVRRKERRYGIWVNTDSVQVGAVPSFYAVATTSPLDTALTAVSDLRERISIMRAIKGAGTVDGRLEVNDFTDALIRIREGAELYQHLENTVYLFDDTLFSTKIDLPSNLVEGAYETRIFLLRDGRIVDQYSTTIPVKKVGLERWIYNLAHEKPLIYGLLSLVIAISAGWLASAFFRYLRF